MPLLVGVAMLAPASVLFACTLRVRGLVPFGLAVLTIASATIVFGTLLTSAFTAYRVGPMLGFQTAALVIAAVTWLLAGKPLPLVQWIRPALLLRSARTNKTIAVIAGAALAAAGIELLLALTVAPNTWDSLMYHLSRVALWIQSGSVFHTDGGSVWELQHQANGEFVYGWTMLLSKGDQLTAVVQVLAACGCASAVYWGARMLRFTRPESVFAAAMFFTMPQIVTQATSTYVDLQAALMVGIFALFAIRGYRDRSRGDVLVAALAAGVAFGVKATAVFAVPGLVIAAVVMLRSEDKPDWRFVLKGLAVVAVAMAVLGSSRWIQNQIEVGSPQGEAAGQGVQRSEPLLQSYGQIAWTFVDIPGLGGTLPDQVLIKGSERVFPDGSDPGPTQVSEDYVSFGPVGWLVLIPLVFWFAFSRRSSLDRRMVAIAAILFVGVHATLAATHHWAPHTLITGVLIASPLLAYTARISWLRHLMVFVTLFTLAVVLAQNAKKPLWPTWSPGLDRSVQQGIPYEWGANVANYDKLLPSDARVLFIGPDSNTWDYPVFGEGLTRYVYRLRAGETPSPSQVQELVDAHDIDAIVWAGVEPPAGTKTEEVGVIAANETVIEYVR